MDLSPDILHGLGLIKDKDRLSDKHFMFLLKAVAESLVGRNPDSLFRGLSSAADINSTKLIFSALSTILLEAAKHDLDATSLSHILQESSCSTERCQLITNIYEQYRDEIRTTLARLRADRRHIVDVDWRLDFYIKDNAIERLATPVYIIDLKTQDSQVNTQTDDIQFSCTRDQLQDLVGKLRDACKNLERTSQNAN